MRVAKSEQHSEMLEHSRTEEEVVDYAVEMSRAKFGDKALPDHFVNAQTLAPFAHVRMQAAAQKWIDSSISKTINCHEDIPETEKTLQGNALLKARHVRDNYEMDCFADDTGLEIEALNGEPGVYSARYAGENCTSEDNIDLVLTKLKNESNRSARFRTVIALLQGQDQVHIED